MLVVGNPHMFHNHKRTTEFHVVLVYWYVYVQLKIGNIKNWLHPVPLKHSTQCSKYVKFLQNCFDGSKIITNIMMNSITFNYCDY